MYLEKYAYERSWKLCKKLGTINDEMQIKKTFRNAEKLDVLLSGIKN